MDEKPENSPKPTSTGLVVLGMHRSGTSALTGALGLCGAWLGDTQELTDPNVENPKGFWERRDIRAICDQLLHAASADWWKTAAFEPQAIPHTTLVDQGRAFRNVVARLEAHNVWAIKEPRLCLLFQLLRGFISDLVCIHVYRNPLEVALSLRARNGFGVAEGLALWEMYNLEAFRASSGLPRLLVSYEALVSNPEDTLGGLLHDLSSFGVTDLRMPESRALEAFITPLLRHQTAEPTESVEFLLPSQRELWSCLQSGAALDVQFPGGLSNVAHHHLRDLESRKGSIDHLAAKAMKLASDVQKQKARSRSLKLYLARRKTEAAGLSSQLEAEESKRLLLEGKLQELASELDAQKARNDELTAKLEASDARARRLSDTAAARAKKASTAAQRVASLEAQLSALRASHSWRLTAPLRAVSRPLKRALRIPRNALRLLWWLGTGQFDRTARAVLPRYRRYVPSRVKGMIPGRMRQAARKRLEGGGALRSSSAQRGKRPPVASPEILAEGAGLESIPGSKVVSTRFGQELQRIVKRNAPKDLANALRKSEAELNLMVARLQSMPDRPLVSIVMPTHNRAGIIGDAIATVLEQNYHNWELLVCDDGSTDETETVVAGFSDSRITYLKIPRQGAAAARNAGLKAARGDIVAYLDSDNFWHPAFLSAVVLALLENAGSSSVYTDFIDFHTKRSGIRKIKSFRRLPFDQERLLAKPYIDLNSFAHRRELYESFGGFNEKLTRRQDYDLVLKYTWLRDPVDIPCLATLYQRNDNLTQITRTRREDMSCVSIIDSSVEGYFKHGLPLVGKRPVRKVTVLSWDLCRNHFSKPFALAEALSELYDVQLISFRFFDEEIFQPLQGVVPKFETAYFPGKQFPDFFESMHEALAAIRGDVIYVVKPRLPSLGLALLAHYQRGTPIILEINDLETVVTSPGRSREHSEAGLDTVSLGDKELLNPYSDLWSRLMHPLAREIPVLLTHNRAIDREFGRRCLYMRNLKDEKVYDPAAYDREVVRRELDFAPEDRVILFGGLIRKHKGIYELVELVERLDDPRYKLLFAGSRPTPDQKKLIERYGERIRVLPPQDREAMARINYAADLVILWLDPSVPASHFQMPYKATDAFAMGPAVIANDISDFGLLAAQGYLNLAPFGDWNAMTRLVRDVFENADETAAKCAAARRLYLRQFSYAAGRSSFELAARRALARNPGILPAAEAFARRFNEFYRTAADSDRDFLPSAPASDRGRLRAARTISGYGESDEDESIVIIDVKDVDRVSHVDPTGVAVVMPSIDVQKGLEAARFLIKRAGMKATIFVIDDTLRQGFIRTLNDAAHRLNVAYLVYLAEDAFPGVNWLRIAYEALEKSGKGLLAFNDGKWAGRIAGFGMVRMQWARKVYGGPILFPGYRAHKADNELTLIARIADEFVYEPAATLIELDASKAFEGAEGPDGSKQGADRMLFYNRFHDSFDSRFDWLDVAPYKDEYLNRRKLRAVQGETYPLQEDTISHVDIARIRDISWQDGEGIAVIMPCIDPERAQATARLLIQRAGIAARVFMVEDTLRQGFISVLNATAAQLDVKFIVYLAEDAFPGENWLGKARRRLEETGKSVLAFNCGKWHGRVAAFGMVRKDWVRQLYGGGRIFNPAYKAHKADNELTVIARVMQQFVYEPDCVLIENDTKKVFKENIPEDKATFHRRFRDGFDGLLAAEELMPLAESYFVPFDANDTAGGNVAARRERRDSLRSLYKSPSADSTLSGSESPGATGATMTSLRVHALEYEQDRKSEPALSGILTGLGTLAGEALQREPFSVMDKTTLPPSGDRRDYWHPAPYWWPDPGTRDGLPYVRKDGERVPGTRMYEPDSEKYDRTRLQRVFDDSLILGLAWLFFADERYARAGARILERFFVDPGTRMNPHLRYAQVRMGHNRNQGTATGLIEAKDMYFYLDAVRLLQTAGVLSDEHSRSFRNWLGSYLEWLLTSEQGEAECAASNNHGTCYDLQVGAIASFLGEKDIVYQTLARAQDRIRVQFAPDGHQPEELKRKATAHYCCFNFQCWTNLAELSSRWGLDLWNFETPPGAGLKNGARWLISRMAEPWPYEQIGAFDGDRFLPIWFAASEHLGDLDRGGRLPTSPYAVKPVFFPHDGIRPFWNLGSYAATVVSQPEAKERAASSTGG